MVENTNRKDAADEEIEIDLVPLMYAILNHLWILILESLVVGVVAYFVLFATNVPQYASKFHVYVNNRTNNSSAEVLTSGDITASQSLAKTYTTILSSEPLVMQAAEKSGISSRTVERLEKKSKDVLSVENVQGTEIILVSVVLPDAQEAFALASAMAHVGPKYLEDIVEGSSMKIIDYPKLASKAEPSGIMKKTLISSILAFLLGAVVVCVMDLRNTAIRSEKDLRDRFDIPVLAVVPNVQESYNVKTAKHYATYGG